MQKRIIFLDVSGSVCFGEYWDTAKIILKACLAQDKNVDTYVCLFDSTVRLLTEKELQQLFDVKSPTDLDTLDFQSGIGSELKPLLEFFPLDFLNDSKIEIISDFQFNDAMIQESKTQMIQLWEQGGESHRSMGNTKVNFYELNVELIRLLTTAKQELETEKKEEKSTEKTFEPTRKGINRIDN